MKLALVLSLLIVPLMALAQSEERGLRPPPAYIEEDSMPVERIETKDAELKLKPLPNLPKTISKVPSAPLKKKADLPQDLSFKVSPAELKASYEQGSESKRRAMFSAGQYRKQTLLGSGKELTEAEQGELNNIDAIEVLDYQAHRQRLSREDQDMVAAGCIFSSTGEFIECPNGHRYKRDGGTSNLEHRRNTKSDLASDPQKRSFKNKGKATAQ